MDTMIMMMLSGLAGVAVGAMGYRYLLKRDPETLERWAQEFKAQGRRL
jgi:hypothetical protein